MPILELDTKCCGCAACVDVCPKKAISMVESKETFLYPKINKNVCIGCDLCKKICPINFDGFFSPDEVKAYIGTSKNKETWVSSSSGGVFAALCKIYIELGYVVCGVQFDKHLQVVHSFADTEEGCLKFKKSKYIQSNTLGIFNLVNEKLKNGYKVLFSGVSCQVAALLSFLKWKNTSKENLVTVNLLCRGVPSQKMFDRYIYEEQEKEGALVEKYTFRNKYTDRKTRQINSRTSLIEFSNGKKYIRTIKNDPFLRAYYLRLFIRLSCSDCHFTTRKRISDFTIADAWGIEKLYPEMDPVKGISLLLVNNHKALDILPEIKKYMKLIQVPSDWAFSSQPIFWESNKMHCNRDKFFLRCRNMSFRKAVFKSTQQHSFRSIIGYFLPKTLKSRIKSVMHMK